MTSLGYQEGEATPRPWSLSGATIYALDETGNCNRFSARVEGGWVWRASGSIGAHGDRTSCEEVEANARLIVTAVNSHDALVEALRRLLDADKPFTPSEIMSRVDQSVSHGQRREEAREHARAVLAALSKSESV